MTNSNQSPAELTVLSVYCRTEKPSVEDAPRNERTMVRRRMNIRRVDDTDTDEGDYETAMFVPKDGLLASMFFHNDMEQHSEDEEEEEDDDDDQEYPTYELNEQERIYEERTVLIQSYEHYETLANDPHTSSYFDSMKTADGQLDPQWTLNDNRFGEQMIVKGLDATQLAVGDVFECPGGLTIEITSPRLACAEVDKKSSSPFGRKGLRRHTNTYGMGGWFARVVKEGEALEGMTLKRVAHPHPKWTLAEVALALYGECDQKNMNLGWAQWNRSKEELQEFCAMEQLGWYEWKDEAQWILDRWDKIEAKKRAQQEKQAAKKAPVALQKPLPSKNLWSSLKPKLALVFGGILLSHQWANVMTLVHKSPSVSPLSTIDANSSIFDLLDSNSTFFSANHTFFGATANSTVFGIPIEYQQQ